MCIRDRYNIQGHQSIEYVITLARKMKLTVEHCATDNYAYTELKSYINGRHNIISTTCNGLPGLKKFSSTLEPGTYTFTSSGAANADDAILDLSLIHISEPTRQAEISYAVFCLKKKKKK